MTGTPAGLEPERPQGRGLPRFVEILLSLGGLVVTSPFLLVACLAVVLDSAWPPLFCQERVGRGGRRFRLWKLRTMRAGGGPEVTATGDKRITPVGRVLRKSKLDELPQLWNVLRGDMALVGPRPELPAYVDLSNPTWRRVLEVRPGITDPVSLRLRFEEKLLASVPGDRARFYREILVPFKTRKYLDYQSVRSPWSDLKVLLLTALAGLLPALAPPYRLADLEAPDPCRR